VEALFRARTRARAQASLAAPEPPARELLTSSGMSRSAIFLSVALAAFLAPPVAALQITVVPRPVNASVEASDNVGGDEYSDDLTAITELPASGALSAAFADSQASMTYEFTESGFALSWELVGNASAEGSLDFSVDTEVQYIVEGALSATQGAGINSVNLLAGVYETRFASDPDQYLLYSQQITHVPNVELEVGGLEGVFRNVLIGSTTGTLLPGRIYSVFGSAHVSGAFGTVPTGSGSGDFRLTLVAVPEPGTVALVAMGLLGLAVRRR
jgi:hypothetical protein